MKNTKIVLTIAIPTYNRCEYLKELLPTVIEQVNKLGVNSENIEILISDNASTDSTSEYVSIYTDPRISYYCNEVNIGGDKNFIECVRRAKGKYVWLFGDDEILLNNALSTIFDIVNRADPVLITVGNGRYGDINKTRTFEDYSAFLCHVLKAQPNYLIANTLITSNIFAKDVFDLEVATRYLNTNYGHMYAIVGNLSKGGKVHLSIENIFKVRDQRAPFSTKLRFLRFKLVGYLWQLGRIYKDSPVEHYCYRFLIECIIDDMFFKVPRMLFSETNYNKYFNFIRKCYRIVKGKGNK